MFNVTLNNSIQVSPASMGKRCSPDLQPHYSKSLCQVKIGGPFSVTASLAADPLGGLPPVPHYPQSGSARSNIVMDDLLGKDASAAGSGSVPAAPVIFGRRRGLASSLSSKSPTALCKRRGKRVGWALPVVLRFSRLACTKRRSEAPTRLFSE